MKANQTGVLPLNQDGETIKLLAECEGIELSELIRSTRFRDEPDEPAFSYTPNWSGK